MTIGNNGCVFVGALPGFGCDDTQTSSNVRLMREYLISIIFWLSCLADMFNSFSSWGGIVSDVNFYIDNIKLATDNKFFVNFA